MILTDETLRYAQEHAGTWLTDSSPAVRAAVRDAVVAHLQGGGDGQIGGRAMASLRSTLFDRLAHLNLDWDLVAQTEVGECRLQGFIAEQRPGTTVRRREAYTGAWAACSELNGRTFVVVSPNDPAKDWATQVWRGKSVIHRAATGTADNPAWPSAGLQHPGCRGSWAVAPNAGRGVSPEFLAYLERLLAARRHGP